MKVLIMILMAFVSIIGASARAFGKDAINNKPNAAGNKQEPGSIALFEAAKKGKEDVVRYLLLQGTNPNAAIDQEGTTALYVAAANGKDAVVDVLIRNGANVNLGLKDTQLTPLHVAIARGHASTVEKLLQEGANPRQKNAEGLNALELARALHRDDMIPLIENRE